MSTPPIATREPAVAPAPAAANGPKWVKAVAIAALPCSLIPFVGLILGAVGLGAGLVHRRRSAVIMSSIAVPIALLITIGVAASPAPAPQSALAASAATPTAAAAPARPAPATVAATPAPAVAPTPGASAATRGLLDPISYWDRTYQRVPDSECTAEDETKLPLGALDGWRIGSGVACYNNIGDGSDPVWHGHIVAVDVYFPSHVTEQVARVAVAALLPADAQAAGPFPGMNNDLSAIPNGSCQHIVYTSATLAAAVRAANPTWTDNPSKADLVFYSGHADSANGSEKAFNPNSINEVLVAIGDGNPHAGVYNC